MDTDNPSPEGPAGADAKQRKADQEELTRLADSLIAAGNALERLTRNVIILDETKAKKD